MIWFSSDFHFGHQNITGPTVSNWKTGFRDFDSVHEMNKTLTQTINKYVKSGDTLYFLGDFAFGGHTNTPSYRHSLVCETIHLFRGNHDNHIDKYKNLFSSIEDVGWCKDRKDRPIFLSHYSHRVWEGSHKGYIHLYGHSHDSIPDHGKSMDVGVDTAYRLFGEYRPFSIDEIVSIMDKRDIAYIDHHHLDTNVR
jgi:calcineurin-like phosphoesterase family protein